MDLVHALHELGALLEVEPSVRTALVRWPEADLPDGDAAVVAKVARRTRLGAPFEDALEPLRDAAGRDADGFVAAVASHAASGASLATTVRAIADAIDARRRLAHEGRAAAAAAKLSGRMLGLFALGSLLVAPMTGSLDPDVALATAAASAALTWSGIKWMRRLAPRPPRDDDPVAAHAEGLAALMRAGLGARQAMDLLGGDEVLDRARRLTRLGMSLPDAIARAGDDRYERLAALIRRPMHDGVPANEALLALARDLRETRRREFELRARRAPVMLVAPLALCLLPAFAIVVIVPLVQGMRV